jgi:hypothetical protein
MGLAFGLTCNNAHLAHDAYDWYSNRPNDVDGISGFDAPVLQPGESWEFSDTVSARSPAPILCGIGLIGSLRIEDAALNSVTATLPVLVPAVTTTTGVPDTTTTSAP